MITKYMNPRTNRYEYVLVENGVSIPLTYEDGYKLGYAIGAINVLLEEIKEIESIPPEHFTQVGCMKLLSNKILEIENGNKGLARDICDLRNDNRDHISD